MSDTVLVAVISLIGTLFGTFGGILTSGRLTAYRIEQLEKKVEKHNNLVERTYILEEKRKAANHRIDSLTQTGAGKRPPLPRPAKQKGQTERMRIL